MKTSTRDWRDGYGLYAEDDNYSISFYVTDWRIRASKPFTADDQWHHIVGTYDGSNIRIWVDGVEGTPRIYTESISDADHSFEIGRGADDSYNFSGALDDVRIYSYALSQDDIKALYAGKEPGPTSD